MQNNIDYTFDSMCLTLVKDKILELSRELPCSVFLFGSRANGSFRRGSDIDIGVTNISQSDFLKLRDDVSIFWDESIVPYTIDLVNFDDVLEDFKEVALKETVLWKRG